MPAHAQKKSVSEQIAERYEKLFAPADDLAKGTQKPGGLGPAAYMNAAGKIEDVIRQQEKQEHNLGHNPEMYTRAAEKIKGYLNQMPQNEMYRMAREKLQNSVTKWELKAKQR